MIAMEQYHQRSRSAFRPVHLPSRIVVEYSNLVDPPLAAPAQSTAEKELSAAQALLSLSPPSPMASSSVWVHPPMTQSLQQLPMADVKSLSSLAILKPLPKMPLETVSLSSSSCDQSLESRSVCDDYTMHQDPPVYYTGSTTLALPADEDFLSPLHSFMRRYCVEVFTAGDQEVNEPRVGGSHTARVTQGQVGIRCVHCKHRRQKRERAVCFPSNLRNLYHSIETWQRRHSLVCEDIPRWVKASMTELIARSRSGAGGRRQYWEESAAAIGLANTPTGIRFVRPPGQAPLRPVIEPVLSLPEAPSRPVVREEDQGLVTDYLYLLLDQMETCQFTESDREGGRSKVKDCPVGFPGMQCRHCRGKAGFGRYFPSTIGALTSANSDRNIYNHLTKCRRCPAPVKEELKRRQADQLAMKNRRGSRKLFFERVWQRIHAASL